MKNPIKKIIFGAIIGIAVFNLVTGVVFAERTAGNFWSYDGVAIFPNPSTLTLGNISNRISEGWFTALNATNLTIGGASSGNLDMGGYQITNIATTTASTFVATSTTATSTFAGGVSVGSRGYGFADGTYQITAASAGVGLGDDNTWTGLNVFSTGLSSASTTLSDLTASYAVVTNAVKKLVSLAYTSSATPSTIVSRDAIGDSAFTGIQTTNATSTAKQNIPNGASPSVVTTGDIAIDTTSDQLVGFAGSAKKVYGNGNIYAGFTYATSTAWTATTTIPLGTARVGETWNDAQCYTDVGTLNVSINDGTNRMDMFNASTTVGTVTLSTNNTFTSGEKRYVDIGTPASSPTKISCTISRSIVAD